jgi:hypothetical protein
MSVGRKITEDELILTRMSLNRVALWLGISEDDSGTTAGQRHEFVEIIAKEVGALSEYDWSKAEYGNLATLVRRKNIGKPLKFRGSIRTMSSVTPCYDLEREIDNIDVELVDCEGDDIGTCPIASSDLLNKVQNSFAAYHTFDFFGTILPAKPASRKARNPDFVFFLVDLEPSENPLQMVFASAKEISDAKSMVAELSLEPGGIPGYIQRKLVEIIGIKGLDDAPLLERSLSFVILQALSDGYDAKRSLSHKLHSLIIGSPAVGKKLLVEAVHILNPAFTEAHPGKISVPGIAGTSIRRKGIWTSDPGLIPLAHRGTFAIQDFHHIKRKIEVMGVLSMVMEDGRVMDSTAANKLHHALTSIHIDMNKTSHVKLSKSDDDDTAQSRLADLGITMNVLTRFDFIVNIPRDTQRQMDIALEMHTGSQQSVKYPGKWRHSSEARQLQVLVAYLRTAFSVIVIPTELAENYIRIRQEELLRVNQGQLREYTLLGDYQTRLSNSVDKLVFAITRANARNVATQADVDEAFRFVHTKMTFLSTIEAFEIPTSWEDAPISDKIRKRRGFIRAEFAGQEVSVETVHSFVIEKFDQLVSATTIRRDLREIGRTVKHGLFKIEPAEIDEMEK